MVKSTTGKALFGVCFAVVVLALLIHWITPATLWQYREDLLFYLQAHLFLVFASMFAAIVVGIPAGMLLSRPALQGQAERLMQIFNVGNTIPPLAVLAIALAIVGSATARRSSRCSSPRCCPSCAIPTRACAPCRRRSRKRPPASA